MPIFVQFTKRGGGQWFPCDVSIAEQHLAFARENNTYVRAAEIDPVVAIWVDSHAKFFYGVRALRCEDGREWDCVNGWRYQRKSTCQDTAQKSNYAWMVATLCGE